MTSSLVPNAAERDKLLSSGELAILSLSCGAGLAVEAHAAHGPTETVHADGSVGVALQLATVSGSWISRRTFWNDKLPVQPLADSRRAAQTAEGSQQDQPLHVHTEGQGSSN